MESDWFKKLYILTYSTKKKLFSLVAVLVISDFQPDGKHMLVTSEGWFIKISFYFRSKYLHVTITFYISGVLVDDFYRFQYGHQLNYVSIKFGCAVNFKGLMWYFGGQYDGGQYDGFDNHLQVRFEVI